MKSKLQAFGHEFDSQTELQRYLELRSMQDAGDICDLEPHPGPFTLIDGFHDEWGKPWRAVRYTGDFAYIDSDGTQVLEEVKPDNRHAKSWSREITLKLKLMALQQPTWRIRIWTPSKRRRAA